MASIAKKKNNNDKARRVVNASYEAAYAAYDSLPRGLRIALQNANRNYSSIKVKEFLNLDMKKRKQVYHMLCDEMQVILAPYLKKVQ